MNIFSSIGNHLLCIITNKCSTDLSFIVPVKASILRGFFQVSSAAVYYAITGLWTSDDLIRDINSALSGLYFFFIFFVKKKLL